MNTLIIWNVVVIGGGPSGMMAAGRAAEKGKKVMLLEKNVSLGKKLLITGGGRCNLTNNKIELRELLSNFKKESKYLHSAFSQFDVSDTLHFFNNRGMPTKEEPEGRVFPTSNKAQSVLDVLIKYMKTGGVTIQTNTQVKDVIYDKKNNHINIIMIDGEIITAKSCIIATGGTSHPETGSTGDCYKWLEKIGHSIVENDVSLVPIVLRDKWVKKLSGLSLTNIKLTTYKNNIKQKSCKGKILFTHFGISGPTVLNMSGDVRDLMQEKEDLEYKNNKKNNVKILLDLFPDEEINELRSRVQKLLVENSNKKIKNTLPLFITPALVNTILEITGIDGETPNHSVRSHDRQTLINLLKAIPMSVSGLLGKDKAIVSSGGIDLKEINLKTMQSRLNNQFYIIGDALNIDRPSGGYSLQLCWTTGYIAGDNC